MILESILAGIAIIGIPIAALVITIVAIVKDPDSVDTEAMAGAVSKAPSSHPVGLKESHLERRHVPGGTTLVEVRTYQ